jgi:hypothetical protein
MGKLSPSTIAINTIAQSLANSASAARDLDAGISEDLRSLLHLAVCEIDRVRKAQRKAASAAKRAADKPGNKSEKKSSPKQKRNAEVAAAPKQKVRRKLTVNGISAH